MGADLPLDLKPHDLARIEIENWRGHCLDLFAKGERVIGQTLESIRNTAKTPAEVKLRHLAGHRADDLAKYVSDSSLPAKQLKGVSVALANWRTHEESRNYMAHAVLTVALDSRGSWFAVFDMTAYRSDQPQFQRWAVSKSEAENLRFQLETGWQSLSAHLGHLKKAINT